MERMTHSPERSRGGWIAAWLVGLALALALVTPACTTSTSASTVGCSLNSDCASGLICALGKCRAQCVDAADCPVTGSSCIDDGRNPVCQPPAEKNKPCTRLADCPTPLACASDYRCRNLCESDADCNVLGIKGRACVKDANLVDYCADPGEYANGALDTQPPANAPSVPVVEPEGGASAIVAALPSGDLIATNIGPGGGTLGTVGVDGVTITIPPNALTSTLAITVQRSGQLGPNGTIGQVFEIGPTGTTFAMPVTIAFNYTDAELAGLAPSGFAVETPSGVSGLWTPLSQIVVDIYAHTIAGQTTHLSPYALVQQGLGSSTVEDAGGALGSDSGSAINGDGVPGLGDGSSSSSFDSSSSSVEAGPVAAGDASLSPVIGVDAGALGPGDASVSPVVGVDAGLISVSLEAGE